MKATGRSLCLSALTGVVSLLYVWVGYVAQGLTLLLATGGALLIVAALFVARRSVPAAGVLLAAGSLPLAAVTWWSIATPVLAVVALVLGGYAIRVSPAHAMAHG